MTEESVIPEVDTVALKVAFNELADLGVAILNERSGTNMVVFHAIDEILYKLEQAAPYLEEEDE